MLLVDYPLDHQRDKEWAYFAENLRRLTRNIDALIRNDFLATWEAFEYTRTHLDELVALTASRVKLPKDIICTTYQEQIAQWDLNFAIDLEGAANAVMILKQLKNKAKRDI